VTAHRPARSDPTRRGPRRLRLVPRDRRGGPAGKVIGVANAGPRVPVGIALPDTRHHLHVLGPTGTGKSTLLLRMILADAKAGRGLAVFDPKGDLIRDVLEAVIAEAEAAAGVLLRLTPHPYGYPRWKQFHTRFRRRYGPGAVVPVTELVADSGLGFPSGYLGSPIGRAARTLTTRDETLIALVQQATADGQDEIVLTEALICALTPDDGDKVLLPRRVELAFQVQAASVEDVRRGAFQLALTGVPRPSSSMAGRFADLLPATERHRWADTYRAASEGVPVQLSFPPRLCRDENVTRTPPLLPAVVALAEYREPSTEGVELVDVADLGVYADARQMHLVRLSTGQRVDAWTPHALEAGVHTPPLARFLAEVGTARSAVYKTFDWGAAARLPYLPRVRHGRTVLFPARWLLRATDLAARGAAFPAWDAGFTAWQQRWRVPAAVAVSEADQRLPLNLRRAAHRALLRARLDHAGVIELREAPTDEEVGWIGRAHEFVLPLHATSGPPDSPGVSGPTARPRAIARGAAQMAGASAWLQAQIVGHPDRHDEILAEHLPHLLDAWDVALRWWYLRLRDLARPDAEQHLALHVHLRAPGLYGQAASHVGAWATTLGDLGLVSELRLATYQPQTGRYGHGPAMDAAEEVFAADSAVALVQLQATSGKAVPAEALTAASLIDLATAYAPAGDGLRWLIDHLPHEHGPLDRRLRDRTFTLANPHAEAALGALPAGEDVLAAWQRRRKALATYRHHLAAQRAPDPVLRSLQHLHHVRMLGVDPDRERLTHRLARAAALRYAARNHRDPR
jgi:thiopeptide-type bacteriocin biosynthesis protein